MAEIIAGVVGFLGMALAGILSPLLSCFCCSPLGSVAAGFGVCAFRRPSPQQAVSRGTRGGLAYAAGGVAGTAVGIVVNMAIGATTGSIADTARQFGLPAPSGTTEYVLAALLLICGATLVIPLLSAGGGALGGVLWRALDRS